jgi:hypothetical protein
VLHGGVLCPACRAGKPQVAWLDAGVLRTMTQLADVHGQTWRRIEISPRALGQLRGVMNHYFVNLLGRKPRMYQYLREFWSPVHDKDVANVARRGK